MSDVIQREAKELFTQLIENNTRSWNAGVTINFNSSKDNRSVTEISTSKNTIFPTVTFLENRVALVQEQIEDLREEIDELNKFIRNRENDREQARSVVETIRDPEAGLSTITGDRYVEVLDSFIAFSRKKINKFIRNVAGAEKEISILNGNENGITNSITNMLKPPNKMEWDGFGGFVELPERSDDPCPDDKIEKDGICYSYIGEATKQEFDSQILEGINLFTQLYLDRNIQLSLEQQSVIIHNKNDSRLNIVNYTPGTSNNPNPYDEELNKLKLSFTDNRIDNVTINRRLLSDRFESPYDGFSTKALPRSIPINVTMRSVDNIIDEFELDNPTYVGTNKYVDLSGLTRRLHISTLTNVFITPYEGFSEGKEHILDYALLTSRNKIIPYKSLRIKYTVKENDEGIDIRLGINNLDVEIIRLANRAGNPCTLTFSDLKEFATKNDPTFNNVRESNSITMIDKRINQTPCEIISDIIQYNIIGRKLITELTDEINSGKFILDIPLDRYAVINVTEMEDKDGNKFETTNLVDPTKTGPITRRTLRNFINSFFHTRPIIGNTLNYYVKRGERSESVIEFGKRDSGFSKEIVDEFLYRNEREGNIEFSRFEIEFENDEIIEFKFTVWSTEISSNIDEIKRIIDETPGINEEDKNDLIQRLGRNLDNVNNLRDILRGLDSRLVFNSQNYRFQFENESVSALKEELVNLTKSTEPSEIIIDKRRTLKDLIYDKDPKDEDAEEYMDFVPFRRRPPTTENLSDPLTDPALIDDISVDVISGKKLVFNRVGQIVEGGR